jgi:hypothetical protein
MPGRRFHPDPRRRLSAMLGWVLLACAASLDAAACGVWGGQTGDCSGLSATGGGPPQGSETGGACGVARALTPDAPSEDGFAARAVLLEFSGTYTGTVASDANGAGGAGNQAGAGSAAGAANVAGSVTEADAVQATSSIEDAGAVDLADTAFWASVGLEAPSEPVEARVTVSYQAGAVQEITCSHQIQIEVRVEVSVGALTEPATSAWLIGDTLGAKLATTFAASSDPDVPALSLELTVDSTRALGTLRPADADAAGPTLEFQLAHQQS